MIFIGFGALLDAFELAGAHDGRPAFGEQAKGKLHGWVFSRWNGNRR